MPTEATPNGPDTPQEQRNPMMDMHDTSVEEKVAGIVEQTRDDVTRMPQQDVTELLQQRLSDAGIGVSDDELGELAARVTEGG